MSSVHARTARDLFRSVRYRFAATWPWPWPCQTLSTDECISRRRLCSRSAPRQTSHSRVTQLPTARFRVLPRSDPPGRTPFICPVHALPCSHSNGKRWHAGVGRFRKSTSVNERREERRLAGEGFADGLRFNNRTKFADVEL